MAEAGTEHTHGLPDDGKDTVLGDYEQNVCIVMQEKGIFIKGA